MQSKKPNMLQRGVGATLKGVKSFYDFIFIQPYFLKRKLKKIQAEIIRLGENGDGSIRFAEERIASILDKARSYEGRTGYRVFEPDDVQEIAASMRYHKVGKDGLHLERLYGSRKQLLDEFLDRVHVPNSQFRKTIYDYMEPFLSGEIVSLEEWGVFLNHFHRPLTNIEECKAMLSILKFAKMEYRTIATQVKRMSLNTRLYAQKTDYVLRNADDFFDLAMHLKNKHKVKFYEYVQPLLTQKKTTVAEIEEALRSTNTAFRYTDVQQNIVQLQKEVAQFQNSSLPRLLISNHEKDFVAFQTKYNNRLYKRLNGLTKKGHSFKYSYQNALARVRNQKTMHSECSLPNSAIRSDANKAIKDFTKYISIASYSEAYYQSHKHQEMDYEWFMRGGFDVAIPLLAAMLRINIFTKEGTSPLYKPLLDALSAATIPATVEFIGYTSFDYLFWGHDGLLLQNDNLKKQFMQDMLASEDIQAKLERYYSEYPEIVDQIEANLQKIVQMIEELKLEQRDTTITHDELYNEMLRRKLIESFESDQPLQDEMLDIYADIVEHEDEIRRAQYIDFHGWDLDPKVMMVPPLTTAYMVDQVGTHTNLMHSEEWDWFQALGMADGAYDATNRWMFYRVWDLGFNSWQLYVRTHLVYKLLCEYRFAPSVLKNGSALFTYAAFKATFDPFTFYTRLSTTGY
jgi:hypothetical protein